MSTVAIYFLFTDLIGMHTAINVVSAAIKNIIKRRTHGKAISIGNSRIMYSYDVTSSEVAKPLSTPKIDALMTTTKASYM